MAWGNVTVDELRAGVGSLRVECLSGHHGLVEEAYTTNVGRRWHALVAFDDGRKGPCLLTNMRHEDEHGGSTEHATFTRCPECGHATVGLRQPFSINHAKGCSMPTADPPDLHSSARIARFSILPPDATPGDREVSISCAICFDSERGCWHASGSGFHGTGDSQSAAALACFEAWMTTRQGWFESNE